MTKTIIGKVFEVDNSNGIDYYPYCDVASETNNLTDELYEFEGKKVKITIEEINI